LNINANNNKTSRDTLNVQTSNDNTKKKKKSIHPAEIYNKILRSNSKNLDNSQSHNKSNNQNINNFDEGKKNILGDLNVEIKKAPIGFEIKNNNKVRMSHNDPNHNTNIEEVINEDKNKFKSNSNNVNFNQISNNEKTITSKFTQLNNTEDYVRGKNISSITNEMLNQNEANHTINGKFLNEGKFSLFYIKKR